MALSLTLVEGGKHVCTYQGACGVTGAPEVQSFDLRAFPLNVRKSVDFREQLWAFYEAVSPAGVSAVDPLQNAVILPAAPAVPETLEVEITSVDAAAGLKARIFAPHTISR